MEGVLKISEAANLGLHAMAYLAELGPGRMVSVSQIAEELGVSKDHLGKVLQRLNKLGLCNSQKGPGGGFALERRGESITLLEILEAIDGPFTAVHCLLATRCNRSACILGDLLPSVHQQVHGYFATKTLSELATSTRT